MTGVCPICNACNWHLAWCPNGPGPSPRLEAGVGFGKKLTAVEEAKQAQLAEYERLKREREAKPPEPTLIFPPSNEGAKSDAPTEPAVDYSTVGLA